MSTNSHNNDNQEVDLTMISKGIGNFFQNINTSIFKAIQFSLKHKIIIGFLFVLGAGLGVYMDTTYKTYDHQIIVQPNFGSTDYLYSKIDLIESKIKESDTVFLKSIGIQNPSKLVKIEIKPIIDIYKFINNSMELLFLVSDFPLNFLSLA